MTKQELFEKYNINESHARWDNQIDNWMSVEVYRIMHGGNLPPENDTSVKWITDFLDKAKYDLNWWTKNVMSRPDWGSLYLTAKRMVYSLSDKFIDESNSQHEVSSVICNVCGYKWVAVRPINTNKLECPKCHNICTYDNI